MEIVIRNEEKQRMMQNPTFRAFKEVVEKIEFTRYPIKCLVRNTHCLGQDFYFSIFALVTDVENPSKTIGINGGEYIMIDSFIKDQKQTIQIIHDAILRFDRHESDEHFYFEGKKIFDPHKEFANASSNS